jgi:hypothetical protein
VAEDFAPPAAFWARILARISAVEGFFSSITDPTRYRLPTREGLETLTIGTKETRTAGTRVEASAPVSSRGILARSCRTDNQSAGVFSIPRSSAGQTRPRHP